MINVLDKGYVRLVDHMGTDISVVNAARVSYDRESQELDERDIKLLNFLVREKHTAPFRHAVLTFEVYAPLFVARQWWKHVIGGDHSEGDGDPYTAWNESSRRYVTENEEFYVPDRWRSRPLNNKQGSGEGPMEGTDSYWSAQLQSHFIDSVQLYQRAMESNIAPEMARLFLPANALYVRWRWTTSLQGAMHFIELRDEAHAQWEIQQYAKAVRELAHEKFPASIEGMGPVV